MPRSRWFVWAVLVWMGCAGTFLAWRMTMTTDEGIHVASAYLALTRGEHRFDPEHPFLYKYATAVPLVLLHPNDPPDDTRLWDAAKPTFYDSWEESRLWSDEWFYKSGNNARLMIFLARLPGVAVLVLLGWFVFYASKKWFGERVALLALFFTGFSPTLLAHGPMTNTDVAVTLAIFHALWQLWRYHETPSRPRAMWVGLAIAISLTTKFSATSILPISFLWFLYVIWKKKVTWRAALSDAALVLATIFVFIWTLYGWQSPLQTTGAPTSYPLERVESALASHGTSLTALGTVLRWILPSAFLKGFVLVTGGSYFGRPTYLLNQSHTLGVWYYFPTLIALKTQIIALVIAAVGVVLAIRNALRRRLTWHPAALLISIAALVISALSITSKLNLGIRHIAPIFPLFFIGISCVVAGITFKNRYAKPILLTIGVAYVLPVLLQFPQLLSYGNAFVHPYENAYLYYHDSNLDWGQQGRDVAYVIKDRYAGETVYGQYPWNPFVLDYYGAHTQWLDPQNLPKTGVVFVTATQLAAYSDFRPFRDMKPDFVLDNTTFFFRIGDSPAIVR